jgi:glycosyltransferase involved in cell wall biosynthesis
MSYWANQDAVIWFASTILPALRAHEANTEFWIVGAGPNQAVKRLERLPGVRVTGAVPDVRPYLAHATAVVVPMRVGRGVQNKVLEAMAMAKPVVASELARSGLDAVVGDREIMVAATPSAFINALREVLSGSRKLTEEMGKLARALVVTHYGWPQNLRQLDELFA